MGDEDEAKDVVQDVFAKLWDGTNPLREESQRTFLLTCVRNRCLNIIAHRKTHQETIRILTPAAVDSEKYDGLKDLIFAGPAEPYPLWTLPESDLARHPYIGKRPAHGIVIFRENSPREEWTVENLVRNGILDKEKGEKLARCRLAPL